MIRPELHDEWATNHPLLWAVTFPDPELSDADAQLPTLEELCTTGDADVRQVWQESRQLVDQQPPELDVPGLKLKACEYRDEAHVTTLGSFAAGGGLQA
jgi:hypothetical protein